MVGNRYGVFARSLLLSGPLPVLSVEQYNYILLYLVHDYTGIIILYR